VEDMKNQGKLIAKGERNGRMFTLDVNMPEVNSMLFTHGKGVGDIGIWHKLVSHVNLQRLKLMEKQNLVGGLPKFGAEEVMSKVCEACQLGKYSCSYSPQQNGVAERKNRHIAEIARAMLNEKNLPNYLWAEAVATAVYIMNRTPTAAVHGMTPEEKFTGKKPDVSHLRVFGCIAYVHVPDEKRSKLDPKAEKCIFIGYSSEQKGYRCFNPSTRKWQVSRDVVFDEMASWYSPLKVAEDGELEMVMFHQMWNKNHN